MMDYVPKREFTKIESEFFVDKKGRNRKAITSRFTPEQIEGLIERYQPYILSIKFLKNNEYLVRWAHSSEIYLGGDEY